LWFISQIDEYCGWINFLRSAKYAPFHYNERGVKMQRRSISPLSSYFIEKATAVVNMLGDQFVTRIETDSGWYVEPPPADSLMEAIREIRMWAGDKYQVSVIEDLNNTELSRVAISRREKRGMQ
jgi:hypothetical protein